MAIERVDIVTSCICNNNCSYCVIEDRLKKEFKTTDQIKSEIKQYRGICNNITLTGGEITIRKDVLELVRYAKKLGFKEIHLQTNGRMLMYEKLCKELALAGVTSLTVSFPSSKKEIFEKLTNVKGSFEQTIEGVKKAKKYNIKIITNTVITKENYRELEEITKSGISLGSDQIQMVFVRPQGQALKNYETIVPKMKDVIPHIIKSIKVCKEKKICFMVEGIPSCLLKNFQEHIAERHMPITKVIATNTFFEVKSGERKVKFDSCNNCKLYSSCWGVWKNYAEKEGNKEFIPLIN